MKYNIDCITVNKMLINFIFCELHVEEVRRLEEELFRQKKDFHTLQEEKQQALEELQQLKKLLSEQQVLSLDQSQKVKELHQQLEAKEELV